MYNYNISDHNLSDLQARANTALANGITKPLVLFGDSIIGGYRQVLYLLAKSQLIAEQKAQLEQEAKKAESKKAQLEQLLHRINEVESSNFEGKDKTKVLAGRRKGKSTTFLKSGDLK